MPSYRYGVSRAAADNIRPLEAPAPAEAPANEPAAEQAPEPTYRELQAEAKELGVPANLNREELEAGIAAKKAGDGA